MLSYFIFCCPRCGSHDLCRGERTLAYRKELHIVRKGREYLPGDSELMDLEYRSLAGLQCAQCRYPDDRKGSFRWKSWQNLEQLGCLASDPREGKEKFPAWSARLMDSFTAPTFCFVPEKLCQRIKGNAF